MIYLLLDTTGDKPRLIETTTAFYKLATGDDGEYALIGISYAANGELFVHCGDLGATGFSHKDMMLSTDYKRMIDNSKMSKEEKEAATSILTKYADATPCSVVLGDDQCLHMTMFFDIVDEEAIQTKVAELKALFVASYKPVKNNRLSFYAFRKHVLLEGEKGSGKTYGIHELVDNAGWKKVFIGGHEGVESIDLLGHLIQYCDAPQKTQKDLFDVSPSAKMVWRDGALTEAFRSAAAGEKTVLFIDEMLRIHKRELNILVAALTPDNQRRYTLRTNRALSIQNDVAVEEVLSVPVENLWVVGTTNVGANYAVDEIDEALADRFRVIVKNNDREMIMSALAAIAEGKGLSEVVMPLMKFYDAVNNGRAAGSIAKSTNLRHLTEVLEMSESVQDVRQLLTDLIPTLTERNLDGKIVEEQQDFLSSAIRSAFSN
jgi:hypothetical protein